MLKKNTILAAMVRLEHFTVASLAEAANEKQATVRTVLNRNSDCVIKQRSLSETRRRGGQPDEYTLSDAGKRKIEAGLRQIFATLTDDWRKKDWAPAFGHVPLSLATAEEALEAVDRHWDDDRKARFFLKRVGSNLSLLKRESGDGSVGGDDDIARRVRHVEESYARRVKDVEMRADRHRSAPPMLVPAMADRAAARRHVFEEVSNSLRELRLNVSYEPGEVSLLIGPAMDDENSKSLAAFIHGGFNTLLSQRSSVKRIDTSWFGEAGHNVAGAADYLLVTVDSGGQEQALDEAIERIHSASEAGMRVIVLDESSEHGQRFERAGIQSGQYLAEAGNADMDGLLALLARSA